MDDEYAKLIRRMNPPRVVIDNNACENATVIQVDSVNKHGILLDVVQVISDMNLVIKKAYISSDGVWFMDVFNVTDRNGNKIKDKEVIDYIQRRLEKNPSFETSMRESVGVVPTEEHTVIELTGTDRPGLLSEICAVLADLRCNVVTAEIWTHNTRAAAVVHVTDDSSGCAIEDPSRLSTIRDLLCNVLRGSDDPKTAKTALSHPGVTYRDRRLHQIMFADRDYERVERAGLRERDKGPFPHVTVSDCTERDYTVVIMRAKDRPKLLFDIVCTLTDMQYVVFHGVVQTERTGAYQEFYIRHVDGFPISSEAERERLIQCLEAAIERRASEGMELELCTEDRVGLLSDITRIFRENSLCIKRAEVSRLFLLTTPSSLFLSPRKHKSQQIDPSSQPFSLFYNHTYRNIKFQAFQDAEYYTFIAPLFVIMRIFLSLCVCARARVHRMEGVDALIGGDKLILRGLTFYGFHGAIAEERTLGQKFVVDVDAWLDLKPAGKSDNLSDSFSYAEIYLIAKKVIEGPAQNLLESVAHKIAIATLEVQKKISAVRVKVGKPHVAIQGPVDYLGVEILRRRGDLTD